MTPDRARLDYHFQLAQASQHPLGPEPGWKNERAASQIARPDYVDEARKMMEGIRFSCNELYAQGSIRGCLACGLELLDPELDDDSERVRVLRRAVKSPFPIDFHLWTQPMRSIHAELTAALARIFPDTKGYDRTEGVVERTERIMMAAVDPESPRGAQDYADVDEIITMNRTTARLPSTTQSGEILTK